MWFYQSRKMLQDKIVNQTCKAVCEKDDKPIIKPCVVKCTTTFSPPVPLIGLPKNHHKGPSFLTVTITLLAASFLLMCAYALYSKLYRTTRITRNANNNNNNNAQVEPIAIEEGDDEDEDEERHGGGDVEHHVWYIRTVGLEQSVISSITSLRYKRDEGLVDGTDCSVCLSEFQEDEALRLLPKCSHAFHVACIDTWLRSHTNCPMCRAPVLVTASPAEAEVSEEEIPASNGGDVERDVEGGETVVTVGEIDNVEPSRRSVSLGCLDAKELEVVTKLRNVNSGVVEKKKLERLKSGGGSSSSSSSSSSSMKRSHSCNGKFVMCRSIRVADSILPLRSS